MCFLLQAGINIIRVNGPLVSCLMYNEINSIYKKSTLRLHYNRFNCLRNTHNRQPKTRPLGRHIEHHLTIYWYQHMAHCKLRQRTIGIVVLVKVVNDVNYPVFNARSMYNFWSRLCKCESMPRRIQYCESWVRTSFFGSSLDIFVQLIPFLFDLWITVCLCLVLWWIIICIYAKIRPRYFLPFLPWC